MTPLTRRQEDTLPEAKGWARACLCGGMALDLGPTYHLHLGQRQIPSSTQLWYQTREGGQSLPRHRAARLWGLLQEPRQSAQWGG